MLIPRFTIRYYFTIQKLSVTGSRATYPTVGTSNGLHASIHRRFVAECLSKILSECPSDPSACPSECLTAASLRSVAFLWGAPKTTDSPMSYDLIVDHIVEGNKSNYAVTNLQFLTLRENTRKGLKHRWHPSAPL